MWLYAAIAAVMAVAAASHFWWQITMVTFFSSALALIGLSKLLGEATEQLVRYFGQNVAGLMNVTLSNLAEVIIIWVAIRENHLELVQAGIVGSIFGNLMLVMGSSIWIGCHKHGTMTFHEDVATLYINQLGVVAITLMLPSIFNGYIPAAKGPSVSIILAAVLVLVYLYYYRLAQKDKRFAKIDEHFEKLNHRWSKTHALLILILTAIGAFGMSELLVGEVSAVSRQLGLSAMFIGFVMLPLLGNIAEHFVALIAARREMTELSLAISVGSAAQVGMVVAPIAVLFGLINGTPFMLDFSGLPLKILMISLVMAFIVLRDNKWNINEGVMLVALYVVTVATFAFTQ